MTEISEALQGIKDRAISISSLPLDPKNLDRIYTELSSEFSDRREFNKINVVVDKDANFDERKINNLYRESTTPLEYRSGQQL